MNRTQAFIRKHGLHLLFGLAILSLASLLVWWSVFIERSILERRELLHKVMMTELKLRANELDKRTAAELTPGVLKDDPSPLTRHEAAFTLGQLGYRTAAPALVEAMLNDESPIVRHESAEALSSIGDDAVLPELEKAIRDKDEDVSNSALIAFEYLSYLERKRKSSPMTAATVKPKIRL